MTDQDKIVLQRMIIANSTLIQYEDVTSQIVIASYKKALSQAKAKLEAGIKDGTYAKKRIVSLVKELAMAVSVFEKKAFGDIAKATTESSFFAYNKMADILSWDGKVVGFNNVAKTKAQINNLVVSSRTKIAGRTLKQWVETISPFTTKAFQTELISAMIRGEGYKTLARNLVSAGDKEGRRNAETIARTYIAKSAANATQEMMDANAGVIDKVEWSAVMENGNVKTGRGTCPRCMALDGNVYPLKPISNRPPIPLHPRCRCMYVPITYDWNELNLKDKDGNPIVVEDMKREYSKMWYERDKRRKIIFYGYTDGRDYANYWRDHKTLWQDNAVGETRANLVRGNRVSFGDLVVGDKAYRDALNRTTQGKKYRLGDLVRIADLAAYTPKTPPIVTEAVMPTMGMVGKVVGGAIGSRYTKIWDLIRPPKGGKLLYNDNGITSPRIRDGIKVAAYEVESLLHPDVLAHIPSVLVRYAAGRRAGHTKFSDFATIKHMIELGNTKISTFVHEYGHAIEDFLPKAQTLANRFRSSRTSGDPLIQINRKGEIGRPDKFFSAYCGRYYKTMPNETELISMGLELMYMNPVEFYEIDEEYFELILKVMWGEI